YNTLTGNLLKQNYTDDTTDITYTYNHLGQVTSITDAAGTRTFAYNEYSELESDTSAIDTTNIQVAESYDALGRSNGYSFIRGSENVQIVAQGYDSKGRIGSASFVHSGASKDFTYNYIEGTSLLQTLVHPNGITTTNTYEANRNLITDINDASSTSSVVERGYTYDKLGRPITRRIARKGTVRNDRFSYDTKSQLTAATMGSDDYAYDYDNIGNRKTAQEIADEVTYDANELNQYTAISDFTPEFDLDGNQTKLQTATGIWNITYNAANRPTTFTSEDGNTVIECAYDYMGRRVTKKVTVDGSVTLNQRYIYRGYLQIAALDLTRTALSTLHLITWNPAEQTATRPLALQISGTWFTYGLDLSKNVTELFTTAGGVETCYTYSPFGAVTDDGDTTSPIQWSSEVYDEELGLVYYNYRSYNPSDGRWINRDPIGIEGGLNLYGFVGNMVWGRDVLGQVEWFDAAWNATSDFVTHWVVEGTKHNIDATSNFANSVIDTSIDHVNESIDWANAGSNFYQDKVPFGADALGGAVGAANFFGLIDIMEALVGAEITLPAEVGGEPTIRTMEDGERLLHGATGSLNVFPVGIFGKCLSKAGKNISSEVLRWCYNSRRKCLGNPFKGKTPKQIDNMFKKKRFSKRGKNPTEGEGGYVNPKTDRSYHLDPHNRFKEAPHVDVNRDALNSPKPRRIKKKYFL
ncbi:MAG: RHS repeat-associated core domain-containing protein, partial [Rikenellaceae bacterium]